MLDIYKITRALFNQIRSDATILGGGYTVTHSDYVNTDPDLAPWIGVYKGPVVYASGSLGRHAQSWDGTVTMTVLVQATHGGSAMRCSERLAQYEREVLEAIWADPTLGGEIDMVTAMEIDYGYSNTEAETLYFQQATITITAKVSTG